MKYCTKKYLKKTWRTEREERKAEVLAEEARKRAEE